MPAWCFQLGDQRSPENFFYADPRMRLCSVTPRALYISRIQRVHRTTCMLGICVRSGISTSESCIRRVPAPTASYHLQFQRLDPVPSLSRPYGHFHLPTFLLLVRRWSSWRADFAFADARQIDSYSRERMETIAGPAAGRSPPRLGKQVAFR